ncbi:neuropeptide FF receptor 2-like [Physella acuta]|uniref:neuropeptide FF receptor 2-like n=1 Tax=Physella acuta TaxID=109671 RepID=UPI0027DB8C85|nr:neuropeptide FF receptor 2-like [Physella acuta]
MNSQIDLTTSKNIENWLQNRSATVKTVKDVLVSNSTLSVVEYVINGWFDLVLCLIGTVTNIIEIYVFSKLGFKETVNISMTFIAFWDLIRITSGGGHRLYAPVSLISPSFGKTWQTFTLMNLHYLHIISSNVSYVLGAYVAVERCLCVSVPFKVKSILTPKLTTTVCAILSFVVFSTFVPIFLVFEPIWIYSEQSNSSIMIYKYTEFYKTYGEKYQDANQTLGAVYPSFSLITMIFSTIIISFYLNKTSKTRYGLTRTNPKTTKQQTMSRKEKQVVKMLLVIINIYIVNIMPRVLGCLAMLIEPEFYIFRFYNNLFWVIMYTVFALDFLNSSVHLFVFYFMSSKFRNMFHRIFITNNECKKEHMSDYSSHHDLNSIQHKLLSTRI